MRIRQIKPGFWTDVRLAGLPPAVRLTYIGLWMIADDGGWFRCDVPQIANELYGYEPRRRREHAVAADVAALVATGRVVLYECGHGQVPHLIQHQRISGEKRVLTVEREHFRESPHVPADAPASPQIPDTVRNGKVRKGKERNVIAPAPTRGGGAGASPFDEGMAAAGLKPSIASGGSSDD